MASDPISLPKTNLHLHLTGSMRPATLVELAQRYGLPVPPPLPDGVHGWSAFQSRYDTARAVLRTAEDLTRVVREAVADNAADGCGWLEIQIDPSPYAAQLGGLDPVLEAVLAGAADAPVGIVVAASWGASAEHALALASLAARYANKGVVGFGLSNDERLGEVAAFAPAVRVARDAGLLVVPHGGFYLDATHVRDCVVELGAHRIGHGVTALADPSAVDLLVERQIALEVCPPSYPPFGVPGVPLPDALRLGLRVALGTDDPLLFGVGLADVYRGAVEAGCADADLATLARYSVEASAAPLMVKARLLAGITAWLDSAR